MDFKSPIMIVSGVENATVLMQSGDHLSVGYKDPNGKFHSINISTQHLAVLATHEQSGAAMIIRSSFGAEFIQGTK